MGFGVSELREEVTHREHCGMKRREARGARSHFTGLPSFCRQAVDAEAEMETALRALPVVLYCCGPIYSGVSVWERVCGERDLDFSSDQEDLRGETLTD